jgi:hypothetical protein
MPIPRPDRLNLGTTGIGSLAAETATGAGYTPGAVTIGPAGSPDSRVPSAPQGRSIIVDGEAVWAVTDGKSDSPP